MMVLRMLHRSAPFLFATLFVTVILAAVFGLFRVSDTAAQGSTGTSVVGWGHSSFAGWIKFDPQCEGGSGDCGGVFLESDGALTGYAWFNPQYNEGGNVTDNIGYIKMDPPADNAAYPGVGYPTGPGTVPTPSQLTGVNLEGWARACTVFERGCSGPMNQADLKPDEERGGWDGWVSLRGQATNGTSYGVRQDGIYLRGFAWGGHVLGWIKFDPRCDIPPYTGVEDTDCNAGVTVQGFNYSMTVNAPGTFIVGQPSPVVEVRVSHGSGSEQIVSLSVDGLPGGATATFLPGSNCSPGDYTGATKTCVRQITIAGLSEGTHTMTVVGRSTNPIAIPDKTEDFTIDVSQPAISPQVDLKANGSDGPLIVAPAQNVEIRWVPDLNGATGGLCRLYDETDSDRVIDPSIDASVEGTFTTPGIITTKTYRIECSYNGTTPGQRTTSVDSVTVNARRRTFEEI